MRNTVLALGLMLFASFADAGVLDGLRELRGTIGEVTQTNREIDRLGREVSPAQTPVTKSSVSQSGVLQSGDVLVSKIANVKIYSEANKKSAQVMQVSKHDEIIYMGEEQNGLYHITAPNGEGWVDKLLVRKQ